MAERLRGSSRSARFFAPCSGGTITTPWHIAMIAVCALLVSTPRCFKYSSIGDFGTQARGAVRRSNHSIPPMYGEARYRLYYGPTPIQAWYIVLSEMYARIDKPPRVDGVCLGWGYRQRMSTCMPVPGSFQPAHP